LTPSFTPPPLLPPIFSSLSGHRTKLTKALCTPTCFVRLLPAPFGSPFCFTRVCCCFFWVQWMLPPQFHIPLFYSFLYVISFFASLCVNICPGTTFLSFLSVLFFDCVGFMRSAVFGSVHPSPSVFPLLGQINRFSFVSAFPSPLKSFPPFFFENHFLTVSLIFPFPSSFFSSLPPSQGLFPPSIPPFHPFAVPEKRGFLLYLLYVSFSPALFSCLWLLLVSSSQFFPQSPPTNPYPIPSRPPCLPPFKYLLPERALFTD